MWKKLVFLLLMAVLLCSPVFMEQVLGAPAKEKIKLTAISCWSKGDFLNTFFEKWINEMNSKAKGELEIQFVGGSEVVKMFEQTEVVAKGLYAMTFTAPGIHYKHVPEGVLHTLASRNADPKKIRETGLTARLDEIYRMKGLTWLGTLESNENVVIYVKKDITKLADLKGLKCRSVPSYHPMAKAVGMVPTLLATEEIFDAFQKGVIQAILNVFSPMMREIGVSPLAKCIILPPLPFGATSCVLVNATKFDALPEHLKKPMVDIAKHMEMEAWDFYGKSVEAEIEKLKGMGVKMVELVGEERDTYMKSSAKGLYEVYLADSPKYGSELMNMVKKYLIKVD